MMDMGDGYQMCGMCYDTVERLFPTDCHEKPEKLLGAPIGMYHCPECGIMLLVGCVHPCVCHKCLEKLNEYRREDESTM